MTVRSLCSYGNTYCMQWVSNKVVTDIRDPAFQQDGPPLDGFL